MTTLALIRHGQASFGAADYDVLSETGEHQARLTGAYLGRVQAPCSALLSGGLVRQRRTAELAALAWPGAPALQTRPAFNEYEAEGLFKAYLPPVLMENPDLAARQRELFGDRALFQKALEGVTAKWLADAPHEVAGVETWPAFNQRVRDALAALHRDFDRDADLALFTSGGPIAAAVASTLELSPEHTIQLNWIVYNASITTLRSTKTGWRLMGFNDIGHLRLENDPQVVTLR